MAEELISIMELAFHPVKSGKHMISLREEMHQVQEHMPLILVLGMKRQAALHKFKTSLIHSEFQGSHGYIVRPHL